MGSGVLIHSFKAEPQATAWAETVACGSALNGIADSADEVNSLQRLGTVPNE